VPAEELGAKAMEMARNMTKLNMKTAHRNTKAENP